MRLLLDEHVDPRVAEGLRRRGSDVVCVSERIDLRGRTDDLLMQTALEERRAIVTFDAADFMPLLVERVGVDAPCPCVVLVSATSFPQGQGPGQLIRALARLLDDNPAPGALAGRAIWLSRS